VRVAMKSGAKVIDAFNAKKTKVVTINNKNCFVPFNKKLKVKKEDDTLCLW
jgi:hypothetical protein